ncbi:MAG: FAD binding domain-containing protein [Beijerinckiaceae bacterium]
MKPVPFEYIRPRTLAEACRILAENEEALPIAGGQTLVPMLAMRLARPAMLVDISRLPELSGIRREGDFIVVGAATRQAEADKSEVIRAHVPLLAKALPWVGHQPTRNRGTIGGSIANADPAAEIPLVARTLDAELVVEQATTQKMIAARDFFLGSMSTALPAGACLREVRFPIWRGEHLGAGFHEISARRNDFAYVAAAAQVSLENRVCRAIALGLGGIEDRPIAVDMRSLIGSSMNEASIKDATQSAVENAISELDIASDLHASAAYRRRLALTFAVRAVNDAFASATR